MVGIGLLISLNLENEIPRRKQGGHWKNISWKCKETGENKVKQN